MTSPVSWKLYDTTESVQSNLHVQSNLIDGIRQLYVLCESKKKKKTFKVNFLDE